MQPVLSGSQITQVSPANTNPTLTKGADLANPKRPYPGYFRTAATDDVQGPFAAKYLLDNGIKKVATIHDKKAYGQGLVQPSPRPSRAAAARSSAPRRSTPMTRTSRQ